MQSAGATEPPFRRICVAGAGLIGGSIAQRIRRVWPGVALAGVDRPAVLDTPDAAQLFGLRASPDELPAAARMCDLTILASPVPEIIGQLERLRDVPSLVTDVGSTKRAVMEAAAHAGVPAFVGGHPMAGSERHGLAHAQADLFAARRWFLVAGSAEEDHARRLEAFVVAMGAEPVWIDAIAHDRAMAFVSHLPQVVALALHNAAVGALGDQTHATSGRAFFEMTRLAASAPEVWQGVLATNADFVTEAIAALLRQLPDNDGALSAGGWVRDAFARAAAGAPARPGGNEV